MTLDRYVFDAGSTALVVVDIQERLLAAMPEERAAAMTRAVRILARGLQILQVPVVLTEQYPRGLGPTARAVGEALDSVVPLEKIEFDATEAPGFLDALRATQASTVVLCGLEAHICVWQTAVGLRRHGYSVWVAADAILSREPAHTTHAQRLLTELGAVVAPTETVLFAALGRAQGDAFKAIQALVK